MIHLEMTFQGFHEAARPYFLCKQKLGAGMLWVQSLTSIGTHEWLLGLDCQSYESSTIYAVSDTALNVHQNRLR